MCVSTLAVTISADDKVSTQMTLMTNSFTFVVLGDENDFDFFFSCFSEGIFNSAVHWSALVVTDQDIHAAPQAGDVAGLRLTLAVSPPPPAPSLIISPTL